MPKRDNSPVPEGDRLRIGGHYQAGDDIDLPPMPDSKEGFGGTSQNAMEERAKTKNGLVSIVGTLVLAAAVVFSGWLMMRGGSGEVEHPNWRFVTAATDASNDEVNYLVHLDSAGKREEVSSIEFTAQDANKATTNAVRLALLGNDLNVATDALQAAQELPVSTNNQIKPPEIIADSELRSAIEEQKQEFFDVIVFDCCDEDGDVVELVINGQSFATVPIVHKGIKLSIPLLQGKNTLTLRGVADGQGGITVSFRTSRGNYFCRRMKVGQEYKMEIISR